MTLAELIDILARPGANDEVIVKKVLLAHLSRDAARHLGISADPALRHAIEDSFLGELGLHDADQRARWLAEAGLTVAQFAAVMDDFATTLTVQAHLGDALVPQIALHRRLMTARAARLAAGAG
jgi:hypothetical protein